MRYSSGNEYIGEWKNDDFNGHGVYFGKEGHKYEGEWENGSLNGKGT